jgi:hypothetical protein
MRSTIWAEDEETGDMVPTARAYNGMEPDDASESDTEPSNDLHVWT